MSLSVAFEVPGFASGPYQLYTYVECVKQSKTLLINPVEKKLDNWMLVDNQSLTQVDIEGPRVWDVKITTQDIETDQDLVIEFQATDRNTILTGNAVEERNVHLVLLGNRTQYRAGLGSVVWINLRNR